MHRSVWMSQRHRAGKLDDCLRQLRGDVTAFTASCITNIFRRVCIPRALSIAYHGYIGVPCSVCNADGRRSARHCNMGRSRKSAGHSAQPSLLSLPDGVIASILRSLPFKDRVRAACIGRKFHDLLSHPRASDLVWERCEISDLPSKGYLWIARWLVQRRAGIKTISYHRLRAKEEGSTAADGAIAHKDGDEHMWSDFHANHAEYGMTLIPLVAGLAPELQLELYHEVADELFNFDEPGVLKDIYNPYWASLAKSLTRLTLAFGEAIPPEGAAALSQLSALQSLDILGSRIFDLQCDISFRLPKVTELFFHGQAYGILDLDCPELKTFCLADSSVQNLCGLGTSLRKLSVLEVGFPQNDEGSDTHDISDLLCMFPVNQMRELEALTMLLRGRLTDGRLFGNLSHLTKLTLLNLSTRMTQAAFPAALPTSLVQLEVDLPCGIPEYLERLPKLQKVLFNVLGTPAHLERPLSPFLAMPGLTSLAFNPRTKTCWHPQVLGIFRQALIDINDSGSKLQLTF